MSRETIKRLGITEIVLQNGFSKVCLHGVGQLVLGLMLSLMSPTIHGQVAYQLKNNYPKGFAMVLPDNCGLSIQLDQGG